MSPNVKVKSQLFLIELFSQMAVYGLIHHFVCHLFLTVMSQTNIFYLLLNISIIFMFVKRHQIFCLN